MGRTLLLERKRFAVALALWVGALTPSLARAAESSGPDRFDTVVVDAGHVKTKTDPLAGVTTITWTGVSRPASLTDAAANKIEVVYDGNGNATEITRSDYNQATSAYDKIVFECVYDALDRRTGWIRPVRSRSHHPRAAPPTAAVTMPAMRRSGGRLRPSSNGRPRRNRNHSTHPAIARARFRDLPRRRTY